MVHNFKHNQEVAKATSGRLLALFFLCIILSLIFYTAATIAFHFVFIYKLGNSSEYFDKYPLGKLNSLTALVASMWFIYLTVVYCCIASKLKQLNSTNGVELAQLMGGKIIDDTISEEQQRLTNIVDEMIIASNIKAPQILISPEQSINAFATGTSNNHVITVSQGALYYLDRDELQTIIAHEIAHIKSGDISLNLKLISLLSGFYIINNFINGISEECHEAIEYNRGYEPESENTKKSHKISLLGLGPVGILLLTVSCITVVMIFFGKLLQAAISRQREFLADSYSIQFTRNSNALINALKKAYAQSKSTETNKTIVEPTMAHLLFVDYQNKLFNTHPSIKSRITKLGGNLDDKEIFTLNCQLKKIEQSIQRNQARKNQFKPIPYAFNRYTKPSLLSGAILSLDAIDETLNLFSCDIIPNSLGSTEQWILTLFAMLERMSFHDITQTLPKIDNSLASNFNKIQTYLQQQHQLTWIHILQQQTKILKQFDSKTKLCLLQNVNILINLDHKLSSDELSYLLVMQYTLISHQKDGNLKLTDIKQEVALLIKALAKINNLNCIKTSESYKKGMNEYFNDVEIEDIPLDKNWTIRLYQAMKKFHQLDESYKKILLSMMQSTINHSGNATVEQNNLLFALKTALGLD